MISRENVILWEQQAQAVRDALNDLRLPWLSEFQVKQLEEAPWKVRVTLICSTDRGRINARSLAALADCDAATVHELARRCFTKIADELYRVMNPSPAPLPPIPSPDVSVEPPPVTRVSCV